MTMAIVMRSAIRNRFLPDMIAWEYYIIETPFAKPKEVGREKAMAYVQSHGLVVAYKQPDGTIRDSPDKAFHEKYKGAGTDPLLSRRIDDVWK